MSALLDHDPMGAAEDLAAQAAFLAEQMFGGREGESGVEQVTCMSLASIALSLHHIATRGAQPASAPIVSSAGAVVERYDPRDAQLGDIVANGRDKGEQWLYAPDSQGDAVPWLRIGASGWESTADLPADIALVSRSVPVASTPAPAIVLDDADDEGPVGP